MINREELKNLLNIPVQDAKKNIEEIFRFSIYDETDNLEATRYYLSLLCDKFFLCREGLLLLEDIVEKVKDTYLKVCLYYKIGRFYYFLDDLLYAGLNYSKALAISEEMSYEHFIFKLNLSLGIISLDFEKYEKAKDYLSVCEKLKNNAVSDEKYLYESAIIFVNGILNFNILNAKKLERYIESNQLSMNALTYIIVNRYLGKLFLKEGAEKNAIGVFRDLLDYIEKYVSNFTSSAVSSILVSMANIYCDLDDFSSALRLCEIALDKIKEEEEKIIFKQIILVKARCLTALGKQEDAFELIESERIKGSSLYYEINSKISEVMDFFVTKLLTQRELFSLMKDDNEIESNYNDLFLKTNEFQPNTDNFNLLNSFILGISKLDTLEDIHMFSYEFLSTVIHFDIFFVGYVDETNSFIRFEYPDSTVDANQIYSLPIDFSNVSAEVLSKGKRIVIQSGVDGISADGNTLYRNDSLNEQKSGIYIPLEDENGIFGVMSVQTRKKDYYTDMDIELFEAFASIFCGAVNFLRREEELKKIIIKSNELTKELEIKKLELGNQKYKDSITGLCTKDGLKFRFSNLLISTELPFDLYLIVFNINELNEFNNLYGRQAGNEYLIYAVEILKNEFDMEDAYIFRFGTQLYVFIINADSSSLTGKIERVNNSIDNYLITLDVKISAGLSSWVLKSSVSSLKDVEILVFEAEKLLGKKQSNSVAFISI